MRLALIGHGKMGRALEALAAERGHEVVAVVTGAENPGGRAITPERLSGAEVALEFTGPRAAVANLLRLAELGIPAVTGTTGWLSELPLVVAAVTAHHSALLHSPNFSLGVQLFLRAARDLAARLAGRAEFDAWITEAHHAAKADAPSGTARRLQEGLRKSDPARAFPITSIRAGYLPGTHMIGYDAPHETIRLSHEARGREAFAAGALAAAEWIRGRRGVFTFEQMLFGDEL
ncbi:MAG TPA: dihydrodipicolinate reductase C-terminal domain-containing protein [Gemmatimonadales bacterium]|nr:dihydrodipicolinate reductase C-terminal domain-containing protein [Gemmatimonadales bacterium]